MNEIIKKVTKTNDIHHVLVSAKKNETLFFEGDQCTKIGIVINGKINIVSYLDDGKEIIYNIINKGEMFGNNLIFSSSPFYRGDVVAQEESEIAFVTKENLLKALSNDQSFLEEFLKAQSDFSKTLNFKIKLLTIDSAKERIKYYLTFHNNLITYKSITKLAKELYLTREALSRTLYKMQSNGEVLIANKNIRLK